MLVTGTQTIKKTQIESTPTQGKLEYVPATSTVYFYSTADSQLVSKISNASVDIGCIDGRVTATGNAQTPINVSGTNYYRSQKVYQFTPSVANPTATYQLTIYLTSAEIAVWGASKSSLKFLKVNDGIDLTSGTINGTNSTIVVPTLIDDQTATLGYIAYTASFTGFSQFVLFDNSIALPIKLTSFTGKLVNSNVVLNWKTSTELGSKEFELERSFDGINFASLYITTAQGLNGSGSNYAYVDKNPSNGANYYRLKSIDNTGAFVYSNIIKINLSGENTFTIAPNPVTDNFIIQFNNLSVVQRITIYDATGREMKDYLPASNFGYIPVNASQFMSGVYFVKLITDKGDVLTQRFIKQ
ncbi:MAG: T9SS type A sorting domain-containing protein [Chitinophagaceae bacterium]|nr:T9SS type A sorting domain-containing protein [Chitinophagaceae bacterium]